MAEKPKKDEKKHSHHSGGEIHFGLEVLLFIVAIFIIWVLTGGAKKTTPENPILQKETLPTTQSQ